MSLLGRLLKRKDTSSKDDKGISARDNKGSRIDTGDYAETLWVTSYLTTTTPAIIYRFSTLKAAREAIKSLTYIHEASDTGELISTKIIDFGCYTHAGTGEIFLGGKGLTKDMWLEARKVFQTAGGTSFTEREP